MHVSQSFQPTHISTATTTQIVTGTGILHSIVVNTTAAGSITVIDNPSGVAGTTLAILKASVAEGTYMYDCAFAKGLSIVTAGASDITVNWVVGS